MIEQVGEFEICAIPESGLRHNGSPGVWIGAVKALLAQPVGNAITFRVKTEKPAIGQSIIGQNARRLKIVINTRTAREADGIVRFTIWRDGAVKP